MKKTKTNAKCENCGSPIPYNRRDTFCSDLCTDDGYDMMRDYNAMNYGSSRGERWGSWDR